MKATALLAAPLLVSLAACATRMAEPAPDPMASAVEQPFRDLNVTRRQAPPILLRAAAEPYRPPSDCAAVASELAALDAALGPDLDAPPAAGGDKGAAFAGDMVRGAASLPFRGVIRRITGAQKRDAAIDLAIAAGVARRGYLKGVRKGMACPA